MGILSNHENADTIAFLSDNQRFIVVNPIELEASVLPLHSEELSGAVTYNKFVKLLSKWGFNVMKDAKYPDINMYSHPLFRKDDWEGCFKITMPLPGKRPPAKEDEARSDTSSSEKNNINEALTRSLGAALLRKMQATNKSRRASGMMNYNPFAMRMFLQDSLVPDYQRFRRGSLSFVPPPYGQATMCIGPQQSIIVSQTRNPAKLTAYKVDNIDAAMSTTNNMSEEAGSAAATNKIVSEAMAALSRTPNHPVGMPPRRHTMHGTNSYQLDAMTEQFLKRSLARNLGSRPTGINGFMRMNNGQFGAVGKDVMAAVGKEVDAQAKILLANRRRTSMGMNSVVGESDSADKDVSSHKNQDENKGESKEDLAGKDISSQKDEVEGKGESKEAPVNDDTGKDVNDELGEN
jgi:hypothetical protein